MGPMLIWVNFALFYAGRIGFVSPHGGPLFAEVASRSAVETQAFPVARVFNPCERCRTGENHRFQHYFEALNRRHGLQTRATGKVLKLSVDPT